MKRKRSLSSSNNKKTAKSTEEKATSNSHNGTNSYHAFTMSEIPELRKLLLSWYDDNKRDLPWRQMAKEEDASKRGYAIWVSEIMLQQTQVATVIDYYNKWMKKWPTLEALASATLEEVNEMWAGLGYYSRGRRLHEGAQKVVKDLQGQMPVTSVDLSKELPGVGRYTAAAIASIAFGEASGVVDGNVIRVFTRMRCIGANSTTPSVLESIWSLANQSVDPSRPGDFNQSMMELGATVCTPKTPACSTCPVQTLCKAKMQVDNVKMLSAKKLMGNSCKEEDRSPSSIPDIECIAENCHLCLPASESWDSSIGVMNYPRKPKKKPQREEKTAVCIIQRNKTPVEYLITQRPQNGLLAGLWEFPSVTATDDTSEKRRHSAMDQYLLEDLQMEFNDKTKRRYVGEVVHIFSHIHQTYLVETFQIGDDNNNSECPAESERQWRWVTKEQFLDSAVSTAMKKVFKAYETDKKKPSSKHKSTKQVSSKKQLGLTAFFKPVTKEGK
ncbi:adenine DNA glycosylase-like [Amphiura filiformis]|uniref:adenine DNA glycosylase-like n=1 Tax=Amphiura filiformis TaxID=82378 RepID=UPI003B216130